MCKVKFFNSLLAVFFVVAGCGKKSVEPKEAIATTVEHNGGVRDNEQDDAPSGYEYYIDDIAVTQEDAETANREHVLLIAGSESDPSNRILQIRYYSSEENKLTFAYSKNIPLKKYHAIEEHLAAYAISSGAVQYAEDNDGEIPAWYTEYQEHYIAEQRGGRKDRALLGFFFKDWVGGGGLPFSGTGTSAFCCTWNNNISRYRIGIGTLWVYGWIGMYDSWFYQNRLYDMWGWTNMTVFFDSVAGLQWVNDRTSSVLHP